MNNVNNKNPEMLSLSLVCILISFPCYVAGKSPSVFEVFDTWLNYLSRFNAAFAALFILLSAPE